MNSVNSFFPLVLVIDDDPSIHLWAERHLVPAGFQVVAALSGEQGVDEFRNHLPDIVLVDIRMPGMDGFDTCVELRQLPRGDEPPILMMTGSEEPIKIEKSFQSGATDFVVKPINWEILIQRLRYMVKVGHDQHELQRSKQRYQTLVDNSPFFVYEIDETGCFTSMNKTGLTSLDKDVSEVINTPYLQYISPSSRAEIGQYLARTFEGEMLPAIEHSKEQNGEIHWYQSLYTLIIDSQTNEKRVLGICQNITQRKRAEIALQENREMLEAILNNTSAVVYMKDLEGKYVFINHQFEELFHISNEQLLGKTDLAIHPHPIAKELRSNDLKIIEKGEGIQFEEVVKLDDGLHTFLSVKFPLFNQEGNVYATCGVSTDISDRKKAEEDIRSLAFYDSLTNLPNRRLLLDRLKQELITAKRTNQYGAIIYMDLDHFKALNDSKGHLAGDELLIQVSIRLVNVLREGDTACRLGGDEFVVLLVSENNTLLDIADKAYLVAKKIKSTINQPYSLEGNDHYFTTSIGITIFPENSNDPSIILQQADTAMYLSKESGRNAINFFKPYMQEAATARIQLEHELRTAIDQQQFVLYYQPQVNESGVVVGLEALIRWQHPEKGFILPDSFIAVAEDINLIIPIGNWIIEEVCRQIKCWERDGINFKHIAINVSVNQFKQKGFIETICQAIQVNDISANKVLIEITESVIINDIDDTIQKMEALKTLGFLISIDDFGTGYSSLTYLKKLPIDQLKIDQSFVCDIANSKDDVVIVETIISMCHHLGLEVIAEGVETEEQFKLLVQKDCHLFQGFYFGQPVSASDLNLK